MQPKKTKSQTSYRTGYVLTNSLIVAMGGLIFGFDLGIITGVIPFIKKQFLLEEFALGWVVAIFELGAVGGAMITSYSTDKIGRKPALMATAISLIITAAGATFSATAFEIGVWRFLQGIGVGAASVLSPLYIAEIAPAKIRGTLVSVNQLTIILGILLSTVSSYYFGDAGNVESWRWMFASSLIPAALFFAGLFFIPESPRWLVKDNSEIQAVEVLDRIGNEAYRGKEIHEIRESLSKDKKKASYTDLLQKSILPLLLIGITLAVLQQFSGANNVTAYMQIIFQKANIGIEEGLMNGMFVGLIFFIFTFLAIALVDRMGRKKMMLVGTSFQALFLFLLALSFNSSLVSGELVLVLVMAYIATYAFTLGPVTWVLLSEIFPNYIREKALSVSTGALWLSTFVVVLVSPYLLDLSPVINFIIFGAMNVFGFLFVWLYVPETKGKSLEEIEKMLIDKS